MTLARRVAFATGIQVAGKVLALGTSLVSVRVITDYLGADGYGAYAIALAGALVAVALCDAGLPMLMARELARDPSAAQRLVPSLLFLRLAICAAILALTAALLPVLPYEGEVKAALLIATAGSLVGVIGQFPAPFFQVHLRLERVALAEVAARVASLGALLVVAWLDLGLLPLVGTIGVGWAVGLVLSFAWSRPYWRPSVASDLRRSWPLLRAALPIGLVAVLGLLHFKVDAILLSFLKPARDVGIYGLAYAVFEQALVVQGLFMAAVFPVLTRAVHGRDTAGSADVMDKSFRFLVVLALVIGSALCALAGPVVRLLGGDGFDDSIPTLQILSFAILPLFATAPFASLLVSLAALRLVVAASTVGILVNIGLNLVVIPDHSYRGAAATTIFSESLGLLMIYAVAHRRAGARVAPSLVARVAALVALVTVVDILLLDVAWWLSAPGSVALCLVAALALEVVRRSDVASVVRRPGR